MVMKSEWEVRQGRRDGDEVKVGGEAGKKG